MHQSTLKRFTTLYGKGRYEANSVPDGYDEKTPLGRPEEKASNRNTQNDNFGKDRLGTKSMKVDDQESFGKVQYKGGSPLALETTTNFVYIYEINLTHLNT